MAQLWWAGRVQAWLMNDSPKYERGVWASRAAIGRAAIGMIEDGQHGVFVGMFARLHKGWSLSWSHFPG